MKLVCPLLITTFSMFTRVNTMKPMMKQGWRSDNLAPVSTNSSHSKHCEKEEKKLKAELEAAKNETQSVSAELFQTKKAYDESLNALETAKQENKNFQEEIADLSGQLEKIKLSLEQQRNAFQAVVETEEAKVLQLTIELSQSKEDFERRLAEKEEEVDKMVIMKMEANIGVIRRRARAEAIQQMKELESDFNDLKIQLGHANRETEEVTAQLENAKRSFDQERIELQTALKNAEADVFQLIIKGMELSESKEDKSLAEKKEEDEASSSSFLLPPEVMMKLKSMIGFIRRKAQAEAIQQKKKLEGDFNDLKIQLGHANRETEEKTDQLEKAKRSFDQERNELQTALENAEAAVDIEEAKVLQLTIEMSQSEKNCERRLADLEMPFSETSDEERNGDTCDNGYRMIDSECLDVDECFEKSHDCKTEENCVNIAGGFKCDKKYSEIEIEPSVTSGKSLCKNYEQLTYINNIAYCMMKSFSRYESQPKRLPFNYNSFSRKTATNSDKQTATDLNTFPIYKMGQNFGKINSLYNNKYVGVPIKLKSWKSSSNYSTGQAITSTGHVCQVYCKNMVDGRNTDCKYQYCYV